MRIKKYKSKRASALMKTKYMSVNNLFFVAKKLKKGLDPKKIH